MRPFKKSCIAIWNLCSQRLTRQLSKIRLLPSRQKWRCCKRNLILSRNRGDRIRLRLLGSRKKLEKNNKLLRKMKKTSGRLTKKSQEREVRYNNKKSHSRRPGSEKDWRLPTNTRARLAHKNRRSTSCSKKSAMPKEQERKHRKNL